MKRMLLLFLACALSMPAWAGPSPATGFTGPASAEIDRAVRSVCSKDVVFLGEDDNHGGATTLALKSLLVERLVRQCGFRGVVFESQFYDFLDFDRAAADGSATRDQLNGSIGALWTRFAEFAPLVDWLYAEARAGRLRLAGMDPQAAGIGAHYSLERLPGELASVLAADRRTACEAAIHRHDNWEYDDSHSFDAAALSNLRGCLHDIRGALDAQGGKAPADLRAMADSYASYLEFADEDGRGLREKAMYANLMWIRARWPKDTRIVVWCATVHAAKSIEGARPGIRSLGSYVHEALGARAAVIGISALAGSHGNAGGHGKPHALAAAAPGSLEARAFAGHDADSLRFRDGAQLKAMGKVPARALDYDTFNELDWSQLLDGVFVLREETAAMAAH
ncbi:MAG TPA: erythromycin esterase family protein [Xanthomonadaceae bacterium]|jgi:erythromycin esterase-like protein